MTATAILAPGFIDPSRESQRVFQVLMEAMARPARTLPLATTVTPPAPLTPELAAIALALADHEAPLWLDPPLAAAPEVVAFLRFHTGAAIVADPAEAAFALIAEGRSIPPFDDFSQGTEDYPDRSTTLIVSVESLSHGEPLTVAGPGIRGTQTVASSPVPADLMARLAANHALFPRGVDLVLAAPGQVAALPRSTRPMAEA